MKAVNWLSWHTPYLVLYFLVISSSLSSLNRNVLLGINSLFGLCNFCLKLAGILFIAKVIRALNYVNVPLAVLHSQT